MVQLWRSFSWLIPVVAIAGTVVFLVVALTSWTRSELETSRAAVWRAVLDGLIGVWVLAVLAITLLPGSTVPLPGEGPSIDVMPFHDVYAQLTESQSWEVPVAQIGGNLVLFASGGVLLGLRWGRGRGWAALVLLALGVGIEAAQILVGGRSAVLDDVLIVVVGGLLGHELGRALRAAATSSGGQRATPNDALPVVDGR